MFLGFANAQSSERTRLGAPRVPSEVMVRGQRRRASGTNGLHMSDASCKLGRRSALSRRSIASHHVLLVLVLCTGSPPRPAPQMAVLGSESMFVTRVYASFDVWRDVVMCTFGIRRGARSFTSSRGLLRPGYVYVKCGLYGMRR